jgi:hypothetical protein
MALLCEHGEPLDDVKDDNNNQFQNLKSNRYGQSNQSCVLINDLGLTNIWPNTDGQIQYFNDKVSGLRVRPGYKLKAFEHNNGTGSNMEYSSGNHFIGDTFGDRISSIELKKDCNTPSAKWDDSCFEPQDTNKYIGSNKTNRLNECNTLNSNLTRGNQCYVFCNKDKDTRDLCSTSINKYCDNLHIDLVRVDPLCNNIKEQVVSKRCSTNPADFNSNTCQVECRIGNDQCKASSSFCDTSNNMNTAVCNEYCMKNINTCAEGIKKYCVGHRIRDDPFCKKVLLEGNEVNHMRGKHNIEMARYCSNEGKNDITNIDSQSKFDNLTNPICACMDQDLLHKKFSYANNAQDYNQLTGFPECFYSPCKNNQYAYQRNHTSNCNLVYCSINAKDIVVKNSQEVAVYNNCDNKSSSNIGNGVYTAPGQSCQMTEWTSCSATCKTGTQTRSIVVASNDGKPCGETTQTCKIQCTTLIEQLKNGVFNFSDLNISNKFIILIIILGIIGLIYLKKYKKI